MAATESVGHEWSNSPRPKRAGHHRTVTIGPSSLEGAGTPGRGIDSPASKETFASTLIQGDGTPTLQFYGVMVVYRRPDEETHRFQGAQQASLHERNSDSCQKHLGRREVAEATG